MFECRFFSKMSTNMKISHINLILVIKTCFTFIKKSHTMSSTKDACIFNHALAKNDSTNRKLVEIPKYFIQDFCSKTRKKEFIFIRR